MTVKVYCNESHQAAQVAETIGGELNLEEASVNLEIECPHEARELVNEELKSTEYSVAVVE